MRRKSIFEMLVFLLVMTSWVSGTRAQTPSADSSYFVPQAGPYSTPVEGDEAVTFFRTCPNNDGNGSLPELARILVVVKQASGLPIPGIPASSICILFNGGTPAQGFSGLGADSVIANSTWNQSPSCPDVRCVQADGPTDANGAAYITFTGAGGVRDPLRKWGHYDTELPVYVSGVKISGRLTSASLNGTYVLRIKNMDLVGGLAAVANQGELVSALDFNAIASSLGINNALSYWRDFDSDGVVGMSDFNLITFHVSHDCDTPNNP
jgi:hypothetical protein